MSQEKQVHNKPFDKDEETPHLLYAHFRINAQNLMRNLQDEYPTSRFEVVVRRKHNSPDRLIFVTQRRRLDKNLPVFTQLVFAHSDAVSPRRPGAPVYIAAGRRMVCLPRGFTPGGASYGGHNMKQLVLCEPHRSHSAHMQGILNGHIAPH